LPAKKIKMIKALTVSTAVTEEQKETNKILPE
jgi:hypothetical protein